MGASSLAPTSRTRASGSPSAPSERPSVTREFTAIAIVAGDATPVPPCGMCRQVLAEFAPRMPVHSYTPAGAVLETTVAELLPHGFSGDFLE